MTAGISVAELDDLDAVLAAHYEALGGKERLESVEAVQFLGVMSIGEDLEAPFIMTLKRPLKSRLEFTVEGRMGAQVYDGSTAWFISPMMGEGSATVLPEEQARAMAEQADLDGPLVNWESKGHQLVLLGVTELDSGAAYEIEVTLATGTVRNYFLDASSLLTVRQVGRVTLQGDEFEVETHLKSYKEVGGLMFPHLIESRANGETTGQRFAIDLIELDPEVSDDLFIMPVTEALSE
jgi:hypothetical protein